MTQPLPFRPARLTTIDPDSLEVGMPLPTETAAITTTLIVSGAIASRDFFPGHHDTAAARAAGQPDVFMNIMTTSGLLSRFLTDWAGPEGVLESLDLRLGVANLPGDTMTMTGEIAALERGAGSCAVTVLLRGVNDRGRHADAAALPPDPEYMKGISLPVEYAPRTIPALLADRAAKRPRAPAACGKGSDGTYRGITLDELVTTVQCLAGVLRDRDVSAGDRVAWRIDNSRGLDALTLFHAVLWAGAVNVPINTRLTSAEVADIVTRSHAAILDVDVADSAPGAPPMTEPVTTTSEAIASVLFTSGTTGRPKGVMHTHGSSLAAGIGWAEALGLTSRDVLQSPFPIFSGAGLHFNGLSCLWAGSEFVIDDYATAASLALAADKGSTVYVAVPSIYAFWLDEPAFRADRLSTLRLLDYGGAAMAPALIEGLRDRLPEIDLMQTYGLTEAGPGGTYLPAEYALTRLGSIGRDCAGSFTAVRVVDDDGDDVDPGGQGELLLRGPAVMAGYLDDPEATEAAFDGEWLRSGDVVRVDDDGFMYVVDRKKDIIVRGGFNVSSAEVEAALLSLPDILDAAVVGVPHRQLGEAVHAFVVLRAGATADPARLYTDMRERIADFKVPRIYTVIEELPRNAAGKVLKPALREMATAQE